MPESEWASIVTPTTRVRLAHVHTLKDGWRLSETTVEYSGPGQPDFEMVDHILKQAFEVGQKEANARNYDVSP